MNKLEQKKENRKIAIVNKTVDLIRNEGYHNVTMEAIASSCEITKRTLYKYFPVKEAIISEVIKISFKYRELEHIEIIEGIENFHGKICYYMRTLIQGIMLDPELFKEYLAYEMKNIVSFNKNSISSGEFSEPLNRIIAFGYEQDFIGRDKSSDLAKDFFMFALIELAKNYYDEPETFDVDKAVEKYAAFYVNGVK